MVLMSLNNASHWLVNKIPNKKTYISKEQKVPVSIFLVFWWGFKPNAIILFEVFKINVICGTSKKLQINQRVGQKNRTTSFGFVQRPGNQRLKNIDFKQRMNQYVNTCFLSHWNTYKNTEFYALIFIWTLVFLSKFLNYMH